MGYECVCVLKFAIDRRGVDEDLDRLSEEGGMNTHAFVTFCILSLLLHVAQVSSSFNSFFLWASLRRHIIMGKNLCEYGAKVEQKI